MEHTGGKGGGQWAQWATVVRGKVEGHGEIEGWKKSEGLLASSATVHTPLDLEDGKMA